MVTSHFFVKIIRIKKRITDAIKQLKKLHTLRFF